MATKDVGIKNDSQYSDVSDKLFNAGRTGKGLSSLNDIAGYIDNLGAIEQYEQKNNLSNTLSKRYYNAWKDDGVFDSRFFGLYGFFRKLFK